MKNKYLVFTLFPLLLLGACGSKAEAPSSEQKDPSSSEQETSDISSESSSESSESSSSSEEEPPIPSDPRPDLFIKDDVGYQEEIPELESYSPSLFTESSFATEKTESLGEGVRLDTNTFKLNNGHKVVANTLYVDLNKASIHTNYSPSKAVVNQSIVDFNNKNEKKAIAGINADFFGTLSVNAYVKDNVIIKDSHNDNGIYDYKDLNADIPASMPMLFGVSNTHARIAPIVENKTVEQTIKSKFTYKLKYASEDKVVHDIESSFSFSLATVTNKLITDYTLIDHEVAGGVAPESGDICYVIKMCEDQHLVKSGQVFDILECNNQRVYTADTTDGYYYLFKKAAVQEELELDDYIGYLIGNDDNKWDAYTDIIGGRQSLVENGEIAPTVTLENSNGAQNSGVPRSCVGINDKHEVVIVAIEGLRYGGKSSSDSDPYGVNLPELAQYMRYIGCYDAMNFDGGGSTQLVLKKPENQNYELRVRSSDYGSYELNSCRKVYNTLLVTEKQLKTNICIFIIKK